MREHSISTFRGDANIELVEIPALGNTDSIVRLESSTIQIYHTVIRNVKSYFLVTLAQKSVSF